jgi:ATP adenylyltransferase
LEIAFGDGKGQENQAVGYEQIWAPWRLEYILGDKADKRPRPIEELLPGADPKCFLCQDAAGGPERQRLTIECGPHSVTVLNLFPYNSGHLLVAPRRHVARLDQLDDDELLEIGRTVGRMVALLEKVMSPEGFNVGLNLGRVAGAGLPDHVHWHIVPRWNGDTNFMPALAAVNVIPQSLDAAWEALTKGLAEE